MVSPTPSLGHQNYDRFRGSKDKGGGVVDEAPGAGEEGGEG